MTKTPHWRQADAHQASEAEKYARPIPSREYLLEALRELGAPQTADSLADALKLKDKGLRAAESSSG